MIRDVKREDVPFVFDSWLKSWRVNRYAGCIPNNLYYATTRANIERLVARGAVIKVACLDSNEDTILGWICYEQLDKDICIHYLYVKDPYLTKGVGQELVKEFTSGFYSYRCNQLRDFLDMTQWKWTPEIARRR